MKNGIKSSVIFSVAILFAMSSFAQPFRGKREGENLMKNFSSRILFILKAKQKEFKVKDSQLEKIKDLVYSFEEKMIQMKSTGSLQSLELRKLLQDEKNLDYEKIRAALSNASKIRQDIFIEGLKTRKEIENILTPEQRETLKAMLKDRIRGRRAFHGGDIFHPFPGWRDRIKE